MTTYVICESTKQPLETHHTITVQDERGQKVSLTFSRAMIRDLAVDLNFVAGDDYMKELVAIWSTELLQALNQRSAKAQAEAIHQLINMRPESPTVQEIQDILST